MTTTAPAPAVRAGHPYHMYDAIAGQPDAIASVIAAQRDQCDRVATDLAGRRRIYLVGIGTSWHAALVGQSIINQSIINQSIINQSIIAAGPECFACNSFEFCTAPPSLTPDDAVIVISHRGTKRSSYDALDVALARGAYTVAITSTEPGPRIRAAHAGIRTVPQEISAAFTVSYTTALTVLAMLHLALAGQLHRRDNGLDELPGKIAAILSAEDAVQDVVAAHQTRRRFVSAGWGAQRANAYEVALKIKETSRADCEGFQIEQLLHGPFCALDADCLLTLIAPAGNSDADGDSDGAHDRGRAGDVTRAARALGMPVWALTNRDADGAGDLTDAGATIFTLPDCPPYLMPIAAAVPLQLFAYHLALARGRHPDRFQQDDPGQAAARAHYDL